jgi:hypothetical protein
MCTFIYAKKKYSHKIKIIFVFQSDEAFMPTITHALLTHPVPRFH